MAHISVVSPVYGAEGCVQELCARLHRVLNTISADYEIILVDDRSPDGSWVAVLAESEKDSRVKGIRLARNFGQHRAITAGLDIADGDWVVVMDCDLQDPPEEIPRLIDKAKEGFEIVFAEFGSRSESALRQFCSSLFWGGLSWLAGMNFNPRVGNFRVLSRRAVKNFCQYREQLRLLGGITALMGFTTTSIPVARQERYAGETSYSMKKLIAISIDIAMAYSDKPLKVSAVVGVMIAILSFATGAVIIMLALAGIVEVPGWASVMVSIYFVCGLILANLGVLGYYLGRTFDETKRRPLYIIESVSGALINESVNRQAGSNVQSCGRVVWITGLSGAGKSTLAKELVNRLRKTDRGVVLLDGDELREVFGAAAVNGDNHGRQARLDLAMQYAHLCHALSGQGLTVVIATISLFKEVHQWNRINMQGYFEVFLDVPIEELRRRDPKGIYRQFDNGEIDNIAGLDVAVDVPDDADWIVPYSSNTDVRIIADDLLRRIQGDS